MAKIEEVSDDERTPVQRATAAAKSTAKATQAALPAEDLDLRYRLRRYLHTLPFLSSTSMLVLGLVFLAALNFTSMLLFSRGFLLTRTALLEVNDCNPIASSGNLDASCSLPPTHSKMVLLVVDALRADFVLPVSANPSPSSHYYTNHISLPYELTSQRPTHSFLSHFIADAPTTTLQRLKGLTTGSLPTFIDAGSNFAGERVGEDNWLAQAKRAGKKLAMIGDETWLNVFPREAGSVWAEGAVWPYDSFNVEDLDTVDSGVRKHLLPLLSEERSKEWDIIIAHNLGLDHAGHRFGAEHSETSRKLIETQRLLEDVVERIDDDTLLVVIGDHGMTDRGDHGGDSREELEAALWIYSKGPALIDSSWFKHPTTSSSHPLAQLFNASTTASELGDRMHLDWPLKGLLQPARSVAQVDLVPTISLLLGLPVPFGNLGLPIPELFFHESSLPIAPIPEDASKPTPKRGFFSRSSSTPQPRDHETLPPLSTLLQATLLTSSQLSHYLATYTAYPSGKDLLPSMPELHFILSIAKSAFRGAHAPGHTKEEMELRALEKFWTYARRARTKARSVWARFDPILMGGGLGLWAGSLVVALRLVVAARGGPTARFLVGRGVEGGVMAAWATLGVWLMGGFGFLGGLKPLGALFLVGLGAELAVIGAPSSSTSIVEAFGLPRPSLWSWSTVGRRLAPLLPVLAHSAIFASNSFTVFEDSVVLYLLTTLLIIILVRSFAAPEARLRKRLIGFTLVALGCVRLMAYSTICREEQAPQCHATFHQPAGSLGALAVIGLAFAAAWFIPTLLRRSLALSASDVALAPAYLGIAVRGLLLSAVAYWAVDWTIAGLGLDAAGVALATTLKTTFARIVLVGAPLTASVVWYYSPLCLRVQREQVKDAQGNVIKTQIKFTGFANALGSSYLLFYATVFTLIFLVNPPPAQLVLTLQLVVVLALLEIFDSERDVQALHDLVSSQTSLDALLSNDAAMTSSSPSAAPSHTGPSFAQISILALLAHLSFFTTGHQSALATIQWSTAFIGLPTLTYPLSPLLVILNTLGGSHILIPLALPLFTFWNLSPTLKDQPALLLARHLLRAGLSYMTYQSLVAFSSALFAAYFRRHLMVWKVFAPRFMLAGISVWATDVTIVLFAMAWGASCVIGKAKATLGTKVAE